MMPREHTCWNPLPCTCEDPDDDATAMTPGVPREARSLSGHDIGREIWIDDGFDQRWESINKISHTRRQTTLNTGHSMIRVYPAHQVVQVRGRDD